MPFNGSGTFVAIAPPAYPAVPGATISAVDFNNFTADLMNNGLSLALVRDGQSAMTGDFNAGGYRVLNVASPVAGTDAATKNYVDGFLLRDGTLPMAGALNMATFKITGLGTPTTGTDAATKDYADLKLALLGGTMGGVIAMGGFAITGLPAPSGANDAARKAYVDTFLPLAGGTLTGALVGTTFTDTKGGLRSIPINAQASGYTLVLADAGKTVTVTGGVTAPNGVFSAGDAVTLYNNSGSSVTLTQAAGLTLRYAGTALTGNRTLAQRGLATVYYLSASEAVVSGAGLT